MTIVIIFNSPLRGQYAENFPRVLLPYENSVCRVSVRDGTSYGAVSHGSGVLIDPPDSHSGQHLVLTCYHVVRDRQSDTHGITVTWDGQQHYAATIAAVRPGCDACLLRITPTSADNAAANAADTAANFLSGIPRIPIATDEIRLGEEAYGFGFGGTTDNRLRCSGGSVFELSRNTYGDEVWFAFAGQFRSGDSGGPVFVVRDGQPFVIGTAWGTSYVGARGHWNIVGTRLRVIHRMFGKESAPAFPDAGGSKAVMVTGRSSNNLTGYGNT